MVNLNRVMCRKVTEILTGQTYDEGGDRAVKICYSLENIVDDLEKSSDTSRVIWCGRKVAGVHCLLCGCMSYEGLYGRHTYADMAWLHSYDGGSTCVCSVVW